MWNRGARLLRLLGRTYDTNHACDPGCILRKDMTLLMRVWISFIQSNIYMVSHTYDLPMAKAYLAFCIMNKMLVDVAAILSDEVYRFMAYLPRWDGSGATPNMDDLFREMDEQ
ncbi:hypothetical protein TanjilG_19415 [Lupinus angustifolius]|uniref:Putative plant transposon protein domain-containing protein n=1 Tax=Lupinus angustifolius TaxID=3871 RepID=A0A4P1R4W5_LUPAN|nr:hypothetical protein TanjilG_19415 [Lupinus angustifolius]